MEKQSLEEVIEALPGAPIMSCRVREKCVPVLWGCVSTSKALCDHTHTHISVKVNTPTHI